MAVVALLGGVIMGVGLLVTAVWVWRWDPSPGSGLKFFPAAHIPGYSKGLAIALGVAALLWLGVLLRASV